MSLSNEMEKTIKTALDRGIIDPELHAGPIEAIKLLCRDADERPEVNHVTYPTLLKYLGALNIVDVPKRGRPPKQQPEQAQDEGKMGGMRGRLYGKLKAV